MSALSHIKSNAVADFTGTVTVFNSAGNTTTANATDLVRPGDWNSAHNFFNTISGNTLGTSTASGTNLAFGATGGLSVSHSTAAGAATLWVSAPASSSLVAGNGISISTAGSTITIAVTAAVTRSGVSPYADQQLVIGQIGNGTIVLDPEYFDDVQFDRVIFPIHNTNATNSSGSHTLSFRVGLYTRNASTLSLWGSASTSYALTHSGTAGVYASFSGMRRVSIPWTATVPSGQYWIAFNSSTASAGANGTYSNFVLSNIASNFLGNFSSAHNTTHQLTLGQGIFTAATNGIPATIAFSDIRGSDSAGFRPQILSFASSTV